MISMKVKPFKKRKMGKKLTLILADELRHPPVAPMEKLNADAKWLENYILKKRTASNNIVCKR